MRSGHNREVPRVLFVNPNYVDYLADGLFHGLRTMFGADVVDFPKAEPMYRSHSPERRDKLRGHGFTLYGLLDDIDVDRHAVLERAQEGEFDLVVFSDIWRTFGLFTEWAPQLNGTRLAVVDGADRFGITTERAGWDCLRHYDIAANGAVMCFRDLSKKPPLCAPHGLDATNCIEYSSADELLAKTRALSDDHYAELQAGSLAWAHNNTTVKRAEEFLERNRLS